MHQAVIASAVRTPVGKTPLGALRNVRPEAVDAVHVGRAEVVVAGGVESMSFVPFPGRRTPENP